MTAIYVIILMGCCVVTYLMGYGAGAIDKQKEIDNKYSLTK